MGHSEAEKVVRNSANPVDVDSLAEVAVEADWVSELVVVGMTVEIVRAGVTSQTRKVVFGLLAFVDSATPYLPSHEQYEDELVLLDEVEIAVAVVAEADVVTAGAVADAVMVVPLVMTRSRLVYSGFNQDATDAAVDAMASSEPSSNVSGIASASTVPREKLTNAVGSQLIIVIEVQRVAQNVDAPSGQA